MDQKLLEVGTKLTQRDRILKLLKEHGRLSGSYIYKVIGDSGHIGRILYNLELSGIITKEFCECGHCAFYQLSRIFKNGKKTVQRRR
jgi:hypothetical protein